MGQHWIFQKKMFWLLNSLSEISSPISSLNLVEVFRACPLHLYVLCVQFVHLGPIAESHDLSNLGFTWHGPRYAVHFTARFPPHSTFRPAHLKNCGDTFALVHFAVSVQRSDGVRSCILVVLEVQATESGFSLLVVLDFWLVV